MLTKFLKQYKAMPLTAKAAMWYVFSTILQKCISFITVPIFTRLMPTAEYGLYSTYLSWYSIITVICTLQLHNCIYINNVVKAKDEKEKDAASVPLLSLSGTITLLIYAIYLIFHNWLNPIIGLPTALVTLIFARVLFEPPVAFWSIKQRYEYKYTQMVIRTVAMVVCNAVLGILFVVLADRNEAIARAFSTALVQIVFGIGFYLYFFRRAKKVFSTKGWRHALKVQLPLVPHGLSLTILSSSDRIMINNLVGATEAAIYSVAYSAGYVVNVLKNSMTDAMKPWIYEKIQKKQFSQLREKTKPVLLTLLVKYIFIIFQYFIGIFAVLSTAIDHFTEFRQSLIYSITHKGHRLPVRVSGALLCD